MNIPPDLLARIRVTGITEEDYKRIEPCSAQNTISLTITGWYVTMPLRDKALRVSPTGNMPQISQSYAGTCHRNYQARCGYTP